MTQPGTGQAPGLEAAVQELLAALNSPNHGSVGTALADLVNTIDKMTGLDLGPAAAQFMAGVSMPDMGAAQQNTAAPAAAPEAPRSQPLPEGESLGAELDQLNATIAQRANDDPKSSYTASLLVAGVEKCAKKLGEEALETAMAASKGDKKHIAAEAADVIYHLLVLLRATGVSGDDVADALRARRGVSGLAEKASRPK